MKLLHKIKKIVIKKIVIIDKKTKKEFSENTNMISVNKIMNIEGKKNDFTEMFLFKSLISDRNKSFTDDEICFSRGNKEKIIEIINPNDSASIIGLIKTFGVIGKSR